MFMYTGTGLFQCIMNVVEGDRISYGDMFGTVDFVSQQYFVIKVAEADDNHGAVRVCVNWDSQYTVHHPSATAGDALQ